MTITKEEARSTIIRFIVENNRYPTKLDCLNTEWLFSVQTYRRLLGNHSEMGLLEEYGSVVVPPDVFCKQCNSKLTSKWQKSFCNTSCAASYNNPLKPRRTSKTTSIVINKDTKMTYRIKDVSSCLNCNIELSKKSQTIYCSTACSSEHGFKQRLNHWLSTGECSENRILRKYITHLDGYKCSCCGLSDWNNKPITLEVEHIDGNSEDDSRENVCLICPNCHSQTDTYKGKNRGNGRHARAQRYRDGKSY